MKSKVAVQPKNISAKEQKIAWEATGNNSLFNNSDLSLNGLLSILYDGVLVVEEDTDIFRISSST